jgi:hypothetical protein
MAPTANFSTIAPIFNSPVDAKAGDLKYLPD